MSLKVVSGASNVRKTVSEAEWECRVNLAAAYRLVANDGINDLTYNHLSARAPDDPNHMLIKPVDIMFNEVTASSLLKYDLGGNPQTEGAPQLWGGGYVIHCGVYEIRKDVTATFHTHSPAVMGVCSQKRGLLPINQYALKFYKRLAYTDFIGFEFNVDMRGQLFRDLGNHHTMLMRNHGCLIATSSIAHAYVLHHFLEMACRGQLAAMTGGAEITVPDEKILDFAASQLDERDPEKAMAKDWPACLRLAHQIAPGFDG